MSPPPERTDRAFGWVTSLLAVTTTLAMLAVVGRVAQVQLRPSEALQAQLSPRVTVKKDLPLRGDITDRRGRVLAATRFAERVIIDPTLVLDVDKTIIALAPAIGVEHEELAKRLFFAMEDNRRRDAALKAAGAAALMVSTIEPGPLDEDPQGEAIQTSAAAGPKPLIRYLKLSDLLSTEQAAAVRDAVRAHKLRGVSLEKWPIREFVGGSEVGPIVGSIGWLEPKWRSGAESRFHNELSGNPGRIGFVRDGSGNPLWIEAALVDRAQHGRDVRLSIDLELQRIATEELTRGVKEADAQGGRIMIIDPITGEVLAMADVYREVASLIDLPTVPKGTTLKRGAILAEGNRLRASRQRYRIIRPDLDDKGNPRPPELARNRCVEDVYEPGSTFKPFVWSVITELGRVKPTDVIQTEGGRWITPTGKPITDVTRAETMTWTEVLINSSNIGMIKGAQKLTPREFHEAVSRFGFGARTNLGLPGESGGLVTPLRRWSTYSHTSVAYGNEIAVTIAQMVRAFSVFARPAELAGTMPRLRLTAQTPTDPPGIVYRVLPTEVATLSRNTMRGVASNMENRHIKPPEGGWRYDMFAKSGTARVPAPPFGYLQHQYITSFLAAGPSENPRIIVLVVIDDPGPERIRTRTYFGAATAGPVVRRVMERSLTYMGTPPSPRADLAAADPR
jgi:cell division protein FtsI (penicillin-binding protein 3)